MIKYDEKQMIDMVDLTDLELLKTHCIYSTDFADLPKARQTEIYIFCQLHATNEYCRLNLDQIRYAVTKQYFGLGF